MKGVIYRILSAFCCLFILGCQNPVNQNKTKTHKNFGNTAVLADRLGVELELNTFQNFEQLLKRTEQITCNDSIPKITIATENESKSIYFSNPCWEDYGCILIKQKNVIDIHNDVINKGDELFFSLDSLASVLKRDIENNGKNPKLSASPDQLLIYISYDHNGIKRLPKLLNQLTTAYENITDKTDINIWLRKRILISPPSPPKL